MVINIFHASIYMDTLLISCYSLLAATLENVNKEGENSKSTEEESELTKAEDKKSQVNEADEVCHKLLLIDKPVGVMYQAPVM